MATFHEQHAPDDPAIAPLIRWHGYAALASVLYVVVLGLLMSVKLNLPDSHGNVAWLSWGDSGLHTPKASFSDGWATHSSHFSITSCRGSPTGLS